MVPLLEMEIYKPIDGQGIQFLLNDYMLLSMDDVLFVMLYRTRYIPQLPLRFSH